MPCVRLSWPSRQLLSARLSTVSCHIVSYRIKRDAAANVILMNSTLLWHTCSWTAELLNIYNSLGLNMCDKGALFSLHELLLFFVADYDLDTSRSVTPARNLLSPSPERNEDSVVIFRQNKLMLCIRSIIIGYLLRSQSLMSWFNSVNLSLDLTNCGLIDSSQYLWWRVFRTNNSVPWFYFCVIRVHFDIIYISPSSSRVEDRVCET